MCIEMMGSGACLETENSPGKKLMRASFRKEAVGKRRNMDWIERHCDGWC